MTLLHMHECFSHLREEADDHDIIRYHHCHSADVNEGGLYKEVHTSPGALVWSLVVGSFGST